MHKLPSTNSDRRILGAVPKKLDEKSAVVKLVRAVPVREQPARSDQVPETK